MKEMTLHYNRFLETPGLKSNNLLKKSVSNQMLANQGRVDQVTNFLNVALEPPSLPKPRWHFSKCHVHLFPDEQETCRGALWDPVVDQQSFHPQPETLPQFSSAFDYLMLTRFRSG